ncbi:MAG: phage portal protein [Pseudomonadota bacterium]
MNSDHVTVKAPRAPRRGKNAILPNGGIGMLRDPAGLNFGRGYYRDASPGFSGETIFSPNLPSANEEINRSRDYAVKHARDADRNQPLMNAGLTKRAINTVGASLRLQYMPNWEALGIDPNDEAAIKFTDMVESHFSLWGEDFRLGCDAQRQGQFGALMLLAARECLGTEGETLIINRYDEERMERYRLAYATFIEIVSCDRLSTPDFYVEMPDKPKIVSGRELDEWGAAVAFHVLEAHPSESNGQRKWARVVRETEWGRPVGIHFFFRHRAGQQRAMPAIIQSLRNVKMLNKFDDAQLEAAVVNAMLSIYVESEGTAAEVLAKLQTATPTGGTSVLGELWDKRFTFYETNELTADGMRIPVLPPGDKITMESTSRANGDSKDFRAAFHRAMASQLNLTYEQFSGDYSETTFSSARAALLDVWRLITADRLLFTQHTAYQIFVGFMEELFVRGDEVGFEWPADWPDFYENMTAYTQCEFRGPGMGWVDPAKDAQGAKLRVEQGLTSPTYEASQQGQSFADNIAQIRRDHALARKNGVAIPGMPEFADLTRQAKTDPDAEAAAGASDGADPDENRDADGKFGEGEQEQQDEERRRKKKEKTDE